MLPTCSLGCVVSGGVQLEEVDSYSLVGAEGMRWDGQQSQLEGENNKHLTAEGMCHQLQNKLRSKVSSLSSLPVIPGLNWDGQKRERYGGGEREKRGGCEVGQFHSPFPLCSGWVRQSQTLLLTVL